MRKSINPKIGDYVLVTKYSDHDPYDPWFIGTLAKIIVHSEKGTYYVVAEDERQREYGNCFKISKQKGIKWLEMYGNGRT